MKFYRDRTKILFTQATDVNISELLSYHPTSDRSDSESDQSPSKPKSNSGSPRNWLKKRMSLPVRRAERRYDSSSTESSPTSSPRSPTTPRTPRSPTTLSPRSPRLWFLRRSSSNNSREPSPRLPNRSKSPDSKNC